VEAARTDILGTRGGKLLLALVLFAGGVSWMSTEGILTLGFFPAVAALVGLGYLSGRWKSVCYALILIPAALVADWLAFGAEVTREDEYEPLPFTPLIVVALPIPMLLVALGVRGHRIRERRRRSPSC
jgi:hypothetical protein